MEFGNISGRSSSLRRTRISREVAGGLGCASATKEITRINVLDRVQSRRMGAVGNVACSSTLRAGKGCGDWSEHIQFGWPVGDNRMGSSEYGAMLSAANVTTESSGTVNEANKNVDTRRPSRCSNLQGSRVPLNPILTFPATCHAATNGSLQ